METAAIAGERARFGKSVRLYSGKFIWPLDPRPGDGLLVEETDLAHMLSGENRFCSATGEPYPVAQHCIHVSKVVAHRLGLSSRRAWTEASPAEVALVFAALMHDAPEAWLRDIPGPWKGHVWVEAPEGGLIRYRELEDRWVRILLPRFGLSPELVGHPLVKAVDNALCMTEMRDLYEREANLGWEATGFELTPDEMLACNQYNRLEPWAFWVARSEFRQQFQACSLRLAEAARQFQAVSA